MKRFVLAVGVLAMAYGMSSPARAAYAVVKFGSGYCRVWDGVKAGPQDGKYLWWRHHHHVHVRLRTWKSAERHLHWAVAHHRCHHWW